MPLLFKAVRWLGWAYLLYVALCFLIILPALNVAAPWATSRFLDRELKHEILLFNPFTLSLELRDARLIEQSGHQPLAVHNLSLNLALDTLWASGLVLDAFTIDGLQVHVLREANGQFHFQDLLNQANTNQDNSRDDADLLGITVKKFVIEAEELRFSDRTRRGGYTAAYHDLLLSTDNVSTLPERSGDGAFTLAAGAGGTLQWQGDLSLGDGHSTGQLRIDGLDLSHLWRYEAERTNFIVNSSGLDLRVNYELAWLPEPSFTLAGGDVRLHGMELTPTEPEALPDTSLSLSEISVTGIEVSSKNQSIHIDKVAVDGLDVAGFDRQAEVSLVSLLSVRDNSTSDGQTAEDTDEPSSNSPVWTLSLDDASLTNGSLRWHTDQLSVDTLAVTPITASLSDVRWPGNSATSYALKLFINERTAFDGAGTLDTGAGAGSAELSLKGLPLDWFNVQLDPYLEAGIKDGSLDVTAMMAIDSYLPQSVTARAVIEQFSARIDGREQNMVGTERLEIEGLKADMNQHSIDVAKIVLTRPQAGLHILEDGSLNIQHAFRSGDNDVSPREVASMVANSDADNDTKANWRVRVDALQITNGRLDFSDASLPLPFAALIGDIEADILALDTGAEEPLEVALTGAVDGYAPVLIEGRAQPFSDSPSGELTLDFRGIDIATMTPYSGTYAGYAIDSGTLSLNLRYTLNGRVIEGDNRMLISQMQLGEPIDSDLAIELPLKLGIALLTDADGVIDIDVPISGDIDNPDFSLGRVIGRAISNLLIKAVTAPFRLLADLIGSEQDLEQIKFSPGSAVLDEEGLSAISALADALNQRPQLLLHVDGWVDSEVDGLAVKVGKLHQALVESGISEASINTRDADFVAAIKSRYELLDRNLQQSDQTEMTIDVMYNAVASSIQITPAELRELGTQRAINVKRGLVSQGGVDAQRISVSFSSADSGALAKMKLDG